MLCAREALHALLCIIVNQIYAIWVDCSCFILTGNDTYLISNSGPVYMDNVTCTGSESRLIDCVYDNNTTEDTHAGEAGVQCHPC